MTDFDVLIVGAGISGIGAAVHLQDKHPGKTYAILEAREAIGGTWDLFRYPGIRSDSDLHTFCYAFKPWIAEKSIADAPSILAYVRETAAEHGIENHIRFGQKVLAADWSSAEEHWTVRTSQGEELTARWLFSAGGYFRYDEAYTPEFPGRERFTGPVVHPQFWPEDLDYEGKRVVVIGSGATAMTLVPAMAGRAAHVTLLQRTPTYVVSAPAVDPIHAWLKERFGAERAHRVARWKNLRLAKLVYGGSRRYPDRVRKLIRAGAVRALPEGYDVDKHFNPPYDPWDQRMCLVPDGDLFASISEGRASMVTDRIATFTETGIELESGETIEADVVVTATGLKLVALAGIDYSVDGRAIALRDTVTYKGMMLTGVPNFVYAVGYTNNSWTLKVDLICEHFCRLLSLMDERGETWCVPEAPGTHEPTRPLLDLTSGYVQRAMADFPRQGVRPPWELKMDYLHDRKVLLDGPVGDHMRFSRSAAPKLPPGPRMPRWAAGIVVVTNQGSVLRRLKKRYGDAFTIDLPVFGPGVIVSRPDLVKQMFTASPDVLRFGENSPLGQVLGPGSLFSLDGAEHLRERRLLLPPFHGDRMKSYEGIIEEEAHRELATWPEDVEFATLPSFMRITLNAILRAVFGAHGPYQRELAELLPGLVGLGSKLTLGTWLRRDLGPLSPGGRFARYRRSYDAIVDRMIDETLADPLLEERSDVMALLLRANYDDGSSMSRSAIADELLTLLAAGHETTATSLAWAVERLRRHPAVLERLKAEAEGEERELRVATINEIQRTRPVITGTGRLVATDVFELGEWRVPKGYRVFASATMIHNDERFFERPWQFDPDRFVGRKPDTYTWIPFGGGTRRCIGAAFAQMEMDIVLRTLLREFDLVATGERGEKWRSRGVAFAPARGGRAVVRRPPREVRSLHGHRGSEPAPVLAS